MQTANLKVFGLDVVGRLEVLAMLARWQAKDTGAQNDREVYGFPKLVDELSGVHSFEEYAATKEINELYDENQLSDLQIFEIIKAIAEGIYELAESASDEDWDPYEEMEAEE